jgi:hypothetical protein
MCDTLQYTSYGVGDGIAACQLAICQVYTHVNMALACSGKQASGCTHGRLLIG